MNLIVILLEREGYGVIQATSAEEGIELAAAQAPDLILMDVALPGHGRPGSDAASEIRARTHRRIPVIALTAQAMKQDAERASLAGCDGFIVKPISTAAFPRRGRTISRRRETG